MAADFPLLYCLSFADARKRDRLDLWQIGHAKKTAQLQPANQSLSGQIEMGMG